MVGAGKVFHLSKAETMKKFIAKETGIEDKTAPGFLPAMYAIAKDLWAPADSIKKTPVNLCCDERGVS